MKGAIMWGSAPRLVASEIKIAWRPVGFSLSIASVIWLSIAILGEPRFLAFYRLSFIADGPQSVVWSSHAIVALAWALEHLGAPRQPSKRSREGICAACGALMLIGLILAVCLWILTLCLAPASPSTDVLRRFPATSFLGTLPVSFLFPSVLATAANRFALAMLLASLLLANQAAVALCTVDLHQGMTFLGPTLLVLLGSVLLVVQKPHR